MKPQLPRCQAAYHRRKVVCGPGLFRLLLLLVGVGAGCPGGRAGADEPHGADIHHNDVCDRIGETPETAPLDCPPRPRVYAKYFLHHTTERVIGRPLHLPAERLEHRTGAWHGTGPAGSWKAEAG